MKPFLVLILCLLSQIGFSQIDSLKQYFEKGIYAYKAQDYKGFLLNMEIANSFRELYPPIIYNMAAGFALNGQTEKAVTNLKTYLTMNSLVNFSDDDDFGDIKETEEFQSAITLANKLNKKVIASQPFRIIEGMEHPESVGIDEISETIYFGDVHARKVYRYENNELKTLVDKTAHPDFFGVMGLDVDELNQRLWICTSMLPQVSGYDESKSGWSSVFYYDLGLEKLKHIATIKGGSNFRDLTVSKMRKIFISDGGGNKIYTVRNDSLLILADLSDQALNLQGLTITDDQDHLIVSDYILGLFQINLESSQVTRVTFSEGTPFKGIDGIYYYHNSLYALQNGTRPMRVMQLFIDVENANVQNYAPYDQSVDYLDEPTQGYISKTHFFYISNSPWSAYDENGNLQHTKPLILRKIGLK
ncbi:YncE family protein [Marinoscillum sp. MHG1-6]|uniref:YncE family protein n=1 Tax=Marinoscillum sp. MHG1-6 TaxID=2959627 RepID=UPI002157FEBB|nr:hypothetical protein [Marinoscillum sp. MHG1-6]